MEINGKSRVSEEKQSRDGSGKRDQNRKGLGTWLVQLEEHVTLDLRVVSSSLVLGVEITKKTNLIKDHKQRYATIVLLTRKGLGSHMKIMG